ncbi:hypothetical protein V6B95_13560 [Thermoanaerobacterium saccharolyticum]|uniref:hypothetical protein n=1 Tax=Thermoanaerobacterium saccharolyticum TaxID=28896 RepID=UPI000AE3DD73
MVVSELDGIISLCRKKRICICYEESINVYRCRPDDLVQSDKGGYFHERKVCAYITKFFKVCAYLFIFQKNDIIKRRNNKMVVVEMQKIANDIDNIKKISIPIDTIKYIIEMLGDNIIWDYNKITGELIIMKRPESYTDALAGLGEDLWKQVGGTKYIEEMRNEWDD